MPKTDSRKANQRRRFQKQRQETRERIQQIKQEAKTETQSS